MPKLTSSNELLKEGTVESQDSMDSKGAGTQKVSLSPVFPANIKLSELNGFNGFALEGVDAAELSGTAISLGGDMNGDGLNDLVVGSPGVRGIAGHSYIVFGKRESWINPFELSNLNGENGFVLEGVDANELSGMSVSMGGDVNGDGLSDLIVGAPFASPGGRKKAGRSYVVFGKQGNWTSPFLLSSLNGENGFALEGIEGEQEGRMGELSGNSVSIGGDMNGDGISDLVVGAPNANPGDPGQTLYAGRSYIVFGKQNGWTSPFLLSSLNGMNGFVVAPVVDNEHSGSSVSMGGDINGDGLSDLIVGAPGVRGPKRTYVVFGKQGNWTSPFLLSNLNGENGFALVGMPSDYFESKLGVSVSISGDVNGDGLSDLVVGSPRRSDTDAGFSYVVFGKRSGWTSSFLLSSLNGVNGFALEGCPPRNPGEQSGYSVSIGGDMNGDGISDLIVGAPFASIGERAQAGRSYVVFGKQSGWTSPFLLSSLNGMNGFALEGIDSDEQSGSSVCLGGDVNGDGLSDLVVGAPRAHPGGKGSEGRSYVILGEKLPPWVINNHLTLRETQTLILNSNFLNCTNPENPLKDLTVQFSLSNIQHGRFFASDSPSRSLTHFLQEQVRKGEIYFEHDSSMWAPTYDVSVGYPIMFANTPPQPSKIIFQQSFRLVNNQLTVNQGEKAILTSTDLSAEDEYNSANNPSLIFSARDTQQGYFSFVNTPTTAIDRFTQAQVQSRVVQFVHNGSTKAPYYEVAVINGAATTAPQASHISFDAMPIFTNNQLSINQGQTVIVTSTDINAVNPYNPEAVLSFMVSENQQGYFSLVSAPTLPITQFTLSDVRIGNIQFVHDNSVKAPVYRLAVTDGRLTSQPQASVVSFDAFPIFLKNSLTINQGESVILASTDLSAINPYDSQASLTFLVDNLQHGYFSLKDSPRTSITRFTQTQVQSSAVQFVHDGGIKAPAYNLTATDGRLNSASRASLISFDAMPYFLRNTLTVNQAETVLLTSKDLMAVNPYDSTLPLTFTSSDEQHGHFEIASTRIPVSRFTQSQVQTKIIHFVPDGTPNAPSYRVTVSDGRLTSHPQAATISFDVPPVLVNNNLKINQGQSVIVTNRFLSASHPFVSFSNLTFIVSDIQQGHFEWLPQPKTAITRFTQGQVQEERIQFITNDAPKAPSYKVLVSDGRMQSLGGPQPALISFRHKPVLGNNQLRIKQGETLTIGSNELSATDPDVLSEELIFKVSDIDHGRFEDINIPGNSTLLFSQQKVTRGNIKFVTDGSEYAPLYRISVSDGQLSTPPSSAIVNFSLKTNESTTDSTVRNAITGGVVSGVVGLGFFALKMYLERKAKKSLKETLEGGPTDMQKRLLNFQREIIEPIVKAVFDQIKTTGCLGYRSDKDTKAYVGAISMIVERLSALGVDLNLSKMTAARQNRLINEIAKQTRLQLVPDRSCCSCAYWMSFFKAAATPAQLEEKADVIAAAVQAALGLSTQASSRGAAQVSGFPAELLDDRNSRVSV